MATYSSKIEFELTVKKYGSKNDYVTIYDKEPKLELLETLNFKALSAVEVLRKLLDYLKD